MVKFSKQEQEDFNFWMKDGNVSKNSDGSYSTQDAQFGNKLKDMDALKGYYFKEFLSGSRYAGGGRTMENRAKKQARKDIKTHLYRPQAPYQSVEKPSEEWERYELPYDTKMQYDFEPDSLSAQDKRYSEFAKGGEATFDVTKLDLDNSISSRVYYRGVDDEINKILQNDYKPVYDFDKKGIEWVYKNTRYESKDEDLIQELKEALAERNRGVVGMMRINKELPRIESKYGKDVNLAKKMYQEAKDFYQSKLWNEKSEKANEIFIDYLISRLKENKKDFANGGEIKVNGMTKMDYVSAYDKRVAKAIRDAKKEGVYFTGNNESMFDSWDYIEEGSGFKANELVGWWIDFPNYFSAWLSNRWDEKSTKLDIEVTKILGEFYFGKPMFVNISINTGGDLELAFEEELNKIKLLSNKIDFDEVKGDIDYDKKKGNTNLYFYKNGKLVMSLKGDWNRDTEELDTIIDIDGETTELNYHPLDSMGGLDLTELQENIDNALRELNTYSAVVSIEGYEEYAEDVEGLENAKALIQDIKGNTRFQVLKGSSVGIGKRVDDSRIVEEFAKGGEAGFDDEGTSMVMYHEKRGNFIIPKGQIYLWLYEGEKIGEKLQNQQYDWVFYPLTSYMMAFQSGYIPPLKRVWTKKFQKEHKGSEHLLGLIKAYLIEKEGEKELFIDMMSVNPNNKKEGIMSYMIKDLRDAFNLSQDQVTFSKLTKEGEKFIAKKQYSDGGGVNLFQPLTSENEEKYKKLKENIIKALFIDKEFIVTEVTFKYQGKYSVPNTTKQEIIGVVFEINQSKQYPPINFFTNRNGVLCLDVLQSDKMENGGGVEPNIYFYNDGEQDITFTTFEEAYNEVQRLGYSKFRDNLGGEYFVNKDLTKKTIYQHKSNPYITLEFLEDTNKGIKGLQKNPKSLSKKERTDGIIVYYSDSEMKQLFDKKYSDGGGVESYDEEKYSSEYDYLKKIITKNFGEKNTNYSSADWGGIDNWTIKGGMYEGVFIIIDDDRDVILMERKYNEELEENEDTDILYAEVNDKSALQKLFNMALQIKYPLNTYADGGDTEEDKYGRGGFMYEVQKKGSPSNDMRETMFTAKNLTELKKKIIEKYGTSEGFLVSRRTEQGYYAPVKFEDGGAIYPDLSLIKADVVNDSVVLDEFEIKKTKNTFTINGLDKKKINESSDIVRVLRSLWDKDTINAYEQSYVLYLNKSNNLIGYYHHSSGGIDGTIMDVQMISGMALKSLAKGVIIAHNHPSESTLPSDADKRITNQIKDALKVFNILLLDSIIITDESYFSFCDEGLI